MKFMFRTLPDGEFTEPRRWRSVARRVVRRLRGKTPVVLEHAGQKNKPKTFSDAGAAVRRARDVLKKGNVKHVTLHPKRGPAIRIRAVVKKGSVIVRPVETVGTPAIDRIVGAVRRRFSGAWTVRDMGICRACNDGSSEHCKCNAWDVGTDTNIPAEETWRRVTAMGRWLMSQGQIYQASNGERGLPVKAVIWMDRYWHYSFGQNGPRKYNGVKHVSHAHVSALPPTIGAQFL